MRLRYDSPCCARRVLHCSVYARARRTRRGPSSSPPARAAASGEAEADRRPLPPLAGTAPKGTFPSARAHSVAPAYMPACLHACLGRVCVCDRQQSRVARLRSPAHTRVTVHGWVGFCHHDVVCFVFV